MKINLFFEITTLVPKSVILIILEANSTIEMAERLWKQINDAYQ